MNEETSQAALKISPSGSPHRAIRGSIVLVLALISVLLMVELVRETSRARAQMTTSAQNERFLAVAGRLTGDTYGLYLVDLENGIIAVYQWVPGARRTGTLRLLAARNTTYDLQLDEYNTEPSPREIQRLVGQSRRINSTEP